MKNRSHQSSIFHRDKRHTLIGSVLTTALIASGVFISGRVSPYEARELIENAMPSVRFLTSAVMTVTATILALMLTLISFSYTIDAQITGTFYQRIKLTALITTGTFIFATSLLVLCSVPISQSDSVPAGWYEAIYYSVISLSALLAGVLVSVAIMLYYAIRNLIALIDPDVDDEDVREMLYEPSSE